MAVVIDASAAAAVLFAEPGADALLRRLLGHTLYAPRLIDYELANVAWKKLQRSPTSDVTILDMLATSARLEMKRSDPDMGDVLALALATGLTPYDASYLWLARERGLPLVTLDRALAAVAEAL